MLQALSPSPFDEAVVLTADGVGDATTTVAVGKNEKLEIKKEIHFPHSLDYYIQHSHIIQDLKWTAAVQVNEAAHWKADLCR